MATGPSFPPPPPPTAPTAPTAPPPPRPSAGWQPGEVEERPASRVSPLAEALGYAGGVLTTIATLYVASDLWAELGPSGRVGLLALATAALCGAAAAVGAAEAIARRLSTTLWCLGGAAATATSYLLVGSLAAARQDAAILASGLTAAALAGSQWRRLGHPALQGLTYLALGAATFGAAGLAGADPGGRALALHVLGLGWAAAAVVEVLRPRRTAVALGLVTALGCAQAVVVDAPTLGLLLGLGTAALATAAATWRRDALVGGLAALAGLVFVPQAVVRWLPFEPSGSTLALLAGVAMLVACGVLVRLAGRRSA